MSHTEPPRVAPTTGCTPAAVRVLYDLGLLALPARLRRHRATEMRVLFTELWTEARARSRGAALWFAARATKSAVTSGLAARLEAATTRGPRQAPPGRRGSWATGWLQDVRYGLRALRREPGFAAVVVVTLAMAIGVNTTTFSIVRMVVTIPIPYHDMERLIAIRAANAELGRLRGPVSVAEVVDLRDSLDSVTGVAAFRRSSVTLTGVEEPARIEAMQITTDYFEVTGLPLDRGRSFLPEEGEPGATDVAILGHGAWTRRFAGDATIVGRDIRLDGRPHRVVGIASGEIEFGSASAIEVWVPLPVHDGADRDQRSVAPIGRLAAGSSFDDASQEIAALGHRLAVEHPATNRGWTLETFTLRESLVGQNVGRIMALLTMAVAFVLMIACVNVANLMLARAGGRSRELAVRAALGASRVRLVRQLLAESLLLALVAGALGLLVTRATFIGLVSMTRGRIGLFRELALDPVVITFALALALTTPLLFGLLPALRNRGGLRQQLTDGGRGQTEGARRGRIRESLVAGQVSLALVLLVVAVLATRTIIALFQIELGFDGDDTLTLRVDAHVGREAPSPAELRVLHEAMTNAVDALTGVEAIGLTTHIPIVGGEPQRSLVIDGHPGMDERDRPWAALVDVSPGFFAVTRLPLLSGRLLASTDGPETIGVAVINDAARQRYWPDGPAVGGRVRITGTGGDDWLEIVGVVGDVRNSDADQPPEPRVYRALAQHPSAAIALMTRTRGAPEDQRTAVVAALRGVAPDLPVEDVRSMRQVLHDDFASDLAIISMLVFFSLVALGLAIAGVYSVIAYTVVRRLPEIGIRIAMGAETRDVLRLLLLQGLRPVAVGVALGLVAGFALARLISSILYGVRPGDPVTFLGVPVVILVAATIACLLPAARAARVDPIASLQGN